MGPSDARVAVGRGEDMRVSMEDDWRMSDMRFGGIADVRVEGLFVI